MAHGVRSFGLRCALAMAALSSAFDPSFARAEPSAARSAPLAVEITLTGPIANDATFPQRVVSWFDAAQYRVAIRKSPRIDVADVLSPGRHADVLVWVSTDDAGEDHVTHLYFARVHKESGDLKYLLRDLTSEHDLDEIGRERIAQVLYLSSVALIEGQLESRREELERSLKGRVPNVPAPATKADPIPPAPPAPSKEPRKTDSTVSFGIGYGATFRGDEGLLHGPRAGIDWLGMAGRFGLRAAVQGALPSTREIGPIDVTFYGVSFALGATFLQRLASKIDLLWFAGPGLDIAHFEPGAVNDPRFHSERGGTDARPTAMAGTSLVIGRSPRVAIVAELSLAIGRTSYDLNIDGERRETGAPWRLAPLLGVEARF